MSQKPLWTIHNEREPQLKQEDFDSTGTPLIHYFIFQLDMILAQMTESERQIIAQQFADIVECADFERGRSSMLDWEAWIQNYLEDPLTTEPSSKNSS